MNAITREDLAMQRTAATRRRVRRDAKPWLVCTFLYLLATAPPSLAADAVITPNGCLGMDGTRYYRGARNLMIGSNGKTCQFVARGAQLTCN
jgi:hypothetical protein